MVFCYGFPSKLIHLIREVDKYSRKKVNEENATGDEELWKSRLQYSKGPSIGKRRFEQRLDESKGISYRDIWKKGFPGRGDNWYEGPRVGVFQVH